MKQIEISETAYQTLVAKHGDVAAYVEGLAKNSQRDDKTIPPIPEHLDAAQLAREQGVGPILDFRDLKGDFYPPGETSDEFLRPIERRRRDDAPRVG